MANFYGSYIGYGSAAGGGGVAGWYGEKGLVLGGYQFNKDDIDISVIASLGNATDFGNIQHAMRGLRGFSNGAFGGRGCAVAGSTDSGTGNGGSGSNPGIQYVTIASLGNAAFFGNLVQGVYVPCGTTMDGTYGIKVGGEGGSPYYQTAIDTCNVASVGNATDFGDMLQGSARGDGVYDGTYGLVSFLWNASYHNGIEKMVVASKGNCTDFGDRTEAAFNGAACCSDEGRGVFGGGYLPSGSVTMDYVTISSNSNALDFGDIVAGTRTDHGGFQNGPRGVFTGGYTASPSNSNILDYITFTSLGNSIDFGDMVVARGLAGHASGT